MQLKMKRSVKPKRNYIFYKHLRKYNHLPHPNGRRSQIKSIARMDLKLISRKEKIENERKREGVREQEREKWGGGGGGGEQYYKWRRDDCI